MRLIVILAALALAAAALPGCAGGSYGSVVEREKMDAIIRGRTTKAELLDSLGSPDKATDLGGGREEILYVRENVASHGNWLHSDNRALWFVLKNNVVEAFGERATVETPKRWPF